MPYKHTNLYVTMLTVKMFASTGDRLCQSTEADVRKRGASVPEVLSQVSDTDRFAGDLCRGTGRGEVWAVLPLLTAAEVGLLGAVPNKAPVGSSVELSMSAETSKIAIDGKPSPAPPRPTSHMHATSAQKYYAL